MAFQTSEEQNRLCRAIWRSITAAGVIWPWLAAPPFSSSGGLLRSTEWPGEKTQLGMILYDTLIHTRIHAGTE